MQHWLTTYNVTGPLLCPTNSKIIQNIYAPKNFQVNLIQETSQVATAAIEKGFERWLPVQKSHQRMESRHPYQTARWGGQCHRTERASSWRRGGLETAWSARTAGENDQRSGHGDGEAGCRVRVAPDRPGAPSDPPPVWSSLPAGNDFHSLKCKLQAWLLDFLRELPLDFASGPQSLKY